MNRKLIVLIIISILVIISIKNVNSGYCMCTGQLKLCAGTSCANSGADCSSSSCEEKEECSPCTETCTTSSCIASCSPYPGRCIHGDYCGPNCEYTEMECLCDTSSPTTTSTTTSCFLAGTPVSMSDGTEKPIEEVKVGDVVLSYDLNTNKKVNVKVLELESPVREDYYIIKFEVGSKLEVTNEHPIYIRNNIYHGWGSIIPKITLDDAGMIVNKINIGDEVLKLDGKWVRITNIIHIKERVQTYNLKKVSKTNTFFAGDVLVHNKGTTPTTTPSSGGGCGSFAIGDNACQGSTCVTCTSSGWVSGSFPGCCGSTCCRTVNAYCSGTYCGGATPTTTPGTTPTTIWGGTTSTPTTTYTTTYTTVYTTSTTVDPCAGVTCADGWENVGNSYPCCDLTDPDNICTCQDQEYQDHYCSGGSCSPYTVTNTQTLRSGCHNCGYCKTCSGGACIDKPGVKGTVTDAFFEPIKGAEVTILGLGLSDITDENGNYFICDFDSGTYDVIASKKGFEPVNKKLDFDGTSIVIDFDFVLYTAGSDCRQDCSKTTDEENLRCHADCDGINGCKFYDQRTKEVCTTPLNRVVGVTESYNSTHKLRCCVGEPYLYKKISGDRLVFPESKNIVRITRIVFWRGQFVRMIVDMFK